HTNTLLFREQSVLRSIPDSRFPIPDSRTRPGGNRTPNRRFWRPVLYQLSYGPSTDRAATRPGPLGARRPEPGRVAETWRPPTVELCCTAEGWLTGLEPATPGATDRCSNRLSYSHHGR